MATIEEIEKRRAERKAGLEAQKQEQLRIDLEALDALEVEHGDERVKRIDVDGWAPGIPTLAAFRLPEPIEFKRYQDMARARGDKPGDPIGAARLLAETCRLYPGPAAPEASEAWKRLLDACPAMNMNASQMLTTACLGKAADAGKG